MLNLKRRDFIPKSEMIALIESVEGVDSVSFYFVGEANEANQRILRAQNPTEAQLQQQVGLNEFGDIIIGRNDLVVLRGGWTDRNGTDYQQGIVQGKPGALNVSISKIVPTSFNMSLNAEMKSQLIKNN